MGDGHRVIRSSKQSTYDPRKAKELKRQKTYTIKKRYQKLKRKFSSVKTVDYDHIEEEEKLVDGDVDDTGKVDGHSRAAPVAEVPQVDKDSNKKSRSKQRKQMLKKTKHGQPLMKYRIQKMLDVLQE